MKSFIVFAAVVAIACANTVGRAGWGSPPAVPSVDLELLAAAAAAGSGQAQGSQALLELVSGNSDVPAQLANVNGVDAYVEQGEDISQVNTVNKPTGATSTINAVDVYNAAVATDDLEASAIGANSAQVINAADTSASGEGAIAAEESSYNSVISKKH